MTENENDYLILFEKYKYLVGLAGSAENTLKK